MLWVKKKTCVYIESIFRIQITNNIPAIKIGDGIRHLNVASSLVNDDFGI